MSQLTPSEAKQRKKLESQFIKAHKRKTKKFLTNLTFQQTMFHN